MSTSELYDSITSLVRRQLPTVRDSQLESLSLALVGVVGSCSSQLAKIARAMPLDTSAFAKEQRLRRLLDNQRISQDEHYQPIVSQALHGLARQRVQLLIDRVLLRNQHNILVVSIGFRRRSIPLVWRALGHRGSSNVSEQKELLAVALALLPAGVTGQLWVYDSADGAAEGQPLSARVKALPAHGNGTRRHRRSPVTYLQAVYVAQELRNGPVNIIAWWERDTSGKLVLHAVMTNLPATARTKAYGKRRMWIETVFRDWQSGGFHLDRCGIVETERVVRLLLILAIAYLWMVSLGRWVVKRGYRHLIDDGGARSWHFSLFQLGVGWVERLRSVPQSPPVILYLYL